MVSKSILWSIWEQKFCDWHPVLSYLFLRFVLFEKNHVTIKKITFQPIQFNALDHEKRFKIILTGLLILITVYVFAIFELANIIEPGAAFKSACLPLYMHVYLLNGGCFAEYVLPRSILIINGGIIAIVMIVSEVCARIMHPANASTAGNPVTLCSPSFIVNNIPFFSLNSSIAFGLGLKVTLHVFEKFFELTKPNKWYQLQMPSLLLIAILATNRLARKHVVLRFRQYFI